MAIYILIFIVLLIDLAWFFVANSKFIKQYPQYEGKFLWSLLFFPIAFQVSIILWDIQIGFAAYFFTSGSFTPEGNYVDQMLYKTLSNWNFISIPIFAIATYYLIRSRIKLQRLLMDWKEGYNKEAKNLIDIIISIAVGSPVIYLVGTYFSIYNNDWLWMEIKYQLSDAILVDFVSNAALSVAVIGIIGILIRFFARKKINYLSQTLGLAIQNENHSYQNESSMSEQKIENNSNSISQLKDLKQLLNDGVISEEEFNEMKKSILAKGL